MFRKKYILTIMLFNVWFGQNWLQNQRLERQFKDAVSSYNEGRYATSEKILNNLLESGYDSFMEEALLLLLKSHIALNKNVEARQTAKTFFSAFPRSALLNYTMESLGDLYVNNSNYESAYRMYSRAKNLSIDDSYRSKIDKKLYRPGKPMSLSGDIAKAKKILKYKVKTNLNKLISIMMENDLRIEKNKN